MGRARPARLAEAIGYRGIKNIYKVYKNSRLFIWKLRRRILPLFHPGATIFNGRIELMVLIRRRMEFIFFCRWKFPDTLAAGSDRMEEQVVVYFCLVGGGRGIREYRDGNVIREIFKFKIMQRLAIFSFIGIVILLLVSTAHESAVRGGHNKTGGLAGAYVSAKPPVLADKQ